MTKSTINVVAGVLWKGGKYLAAQRPEGFPRAGWWEFPGGKIEPDEAKEDALVREFQEELGVTPLEFEFWQEVVHEYDEYVVRLFFFHIHKYSGEVQSLEKQATQWVDPAGPPTLKFLPADVEIVQSLHD